MQTFAFLVASIFFLHSANALPVRHVSSLAGAKHLKRHFACDIAYGENRFESLVERRHPVPAGECADFALQSGFNTGACRERDSESSCAVAPFLRE